MFRFFTQLSDHCNRFNDWESSSVHCSFLTPHVNSDYFAKACQLSNVSAKTCHSGKASFNHCIFFCVILIKQMSIILYICTLYKSILGFVSWKKIGLRVYKHVHYHADKYAKQLPWKARGTLRTHTIPLIPQGIPN